MKKFSTIQKEEQKNKEIDIKYDGYLKVIGYKDYEIVSESDMVIILPYFEEEGYIVLRHEPIPTYEYRYKDNEEYKNITHFLTVVSGTVEKGETLKNTIRRELFEETGIVISDLFKFDIDKDLFVSKGNSAKYYTCFLKLNMNDYKLTTPPTDGSESEKNSKNIKVNISDLDSIKTHDLITEYMLLKLKNDFLDKN